MKARPILFSAPMILALLAGRKTQTRRIVKPTSGPHSIDLVISTPDSLAAFVRSRCRYGVPGDLLWVRETFVPCGRNSAGVGPDFLYRADLQEGWSYNVDRWKPGIHMPRAASRLTLRITDVRVQRLQDISAKDIIAEGAVLRPHTDQFGRNPVSAFDGKVYLDLISLWAEGWDSINGKGAYRANPFVWALTFEVIKENVDAVLAQQMVSA